MKKVNTLSENFLIKWKLNQVSLMGTQEGIKRRQVQAEFIRYDAEQQANILLGETEILKKDLEKIKENDRQLKRDLEAKYGIDFFSPKTMVNLDTGEVFIDEIE